MTRQVSSRLALVSSAVALSFALIPPTPDAAAQPVSLPPQYQPSAGNQLLPVNQPITVAFPSCGPVSVPVQFSVTPGQNVTFAATNLHGLRATFNPPSVTTAKTGVGTVRTEMTLVVDTTASSLPPGQNQTITLSAGTAHVQASCGAHAAHHLGHLAHQRADPALRA